MYKDRLFDLPASCKNGTCLWCGHHQTALDRAHGERTNKQHATNTCREGGLSSISINYLGPLKLCCQQCEQRTICQASEIRHSQYLMIARIPSSKCYVLIFKGQHSKQGQCNRKIQFTSARQLSSKLTSSKAISLSKIITSSTFTRYYISLTAFMVQFVICCDCKGLKIKCMSTSVFHNSLIIEPSSYWPPFLPCNFWTPNVQHRSTCSQGTIVHFRTAYNQAARQAPLAAAYLQHACICEQTSLAIIFIHHQCPHFGDTSSKVQLGGFIWMNTMLDALSMQYEGSSQVAWQLSSQCEL